MIDIDQDYQLYGTHSFCHGGCVTGPLSFPLPRISALPLALPGSGNAVYELVDPNPFEWGPVGKTLNRGLRTRLLER